MHNIERRLAKLEREESRRAVEASLVSVPPELRDFARSLPADAAKGLVKALARDAREMSREETRAADRSLDRVFGMRSAAPVKLGSFDPERAAYVFERPDIGKIRAGK